MSLNAQRTAGSARSVAVGFVEVFQSPAHHDLPLLAKTDDDGLDPITDPRNRIVSFRITWSSTLHFKPVRLGTY